MKILDPTLLFISLLVTGCASLVTPEYTPPSNTSELSKITFKANMSKGDFLTVQTFSDSDECKGKQNLIYLLEPKENMSRSSYFRNDKPQAFVFTGGNCGKLPVSCRASSNVIKFEPQPGTNYVVVFTINTDTNEFQWTLREDNNEVMADADVEFKAFKATTPMDHTGKFCKGNIEIDYELTKMK